MTETLSSRSTAELETVAIAVAARVHAAFERVHRERMAGLPFVNAALDVELVGLRRWHGLWLGVLITPWCMNLMLLPGESDTCESEEVQARWPGLAVGDFAHFAFPAGIFGFIAGRDGEAGEYLACSLFSPMFEFANHAGARDTARACLEALFDAKNAAATDPAFGSAAGATQHDAVATAERSDRDDVGAAPNGDGATTRVAVSKRDFLRGRWSASDAKIASTPADAS